MEEEGLGNSLELDEKKMRKREQREDARRKSDYWVRGVSGGGDCMGWRGDCAGSGENGCGLGWRLRGFGWGLRGLGWG